MDNKAWLVTRSELHLRTYPYFNITTADPGVWSVTFEEKFQTPDGAEASRSWTIQAQPNNGWPGELEADIWRAVEHIVVLRIAKHGPPITNPIRAQLSEIRRHMPGRGRGRTDLVRIKKGLSCLNATRIYADCFYKKEFEDRHEVEMHVIARLETVTRKNADGEQVVDHLLIWIDENILSNINLQYTRPLDKGYLDWLRKWTAKRLYELLGPKFFGMYKAGSKQPYRIRYSRLCALIGIKRQKYLSNAKQNLSRGYHELMEPNEYKGKQIGGFIAQVQWFTCRDERDWVIAFWPGPRAQAEWRKDFWRTEYVPEMLVSEGDLEIGEVVNIENEENITAELRPETELDRFEREFKHVFTNLTGFSKHRLSSTERQDLVEMQTQGVTIEHVRTGIRACVEYRRRNQISEPIQGLGYVRNWIWQAHRGEINAAAVPLTAREKAEDAKTNQAAANQGRAAWEAAKAAQTEALRERQAKLHADLREKITPIGFEMHFADLLLVEDRGAAGLVLLAPSANKARDLRQCYGAMLPAAAGVPVELRP